MKQNQSQTVLSENNNKKETSKICSLHLLWLTVHPFIQSIMNYNGGAVMAMRGKNCVAIAADRRYGIQAQMVTTDFQKVFPMGDRLYIGLAGLATDVQTVWVSLTLIINFPHNKKVFVTERSKILQMYVRWMMETCSLYIVFRAQRLKFRLNLYELKEGRQIKPKTFMSMVSNLLYERRCVSLDSCKFVCTILFLSEIFCLVSSLIKNLLFFFFSHLLKHF